MRKFALYRDPPDFDDDLGDCLPLNGPHVYMVGPAGLGLNINPQIAGFDNFFYKKIKKSSFDPETVSGTIIFYDEDIPKNAYLYYRQFVSFCTHAKNLYFGYAPLANDDPDDLSETFVSYAENGITIRSSVSDLVSFEGDGIYVAGGTHPTSQESTIYKADTEFVSIDKGEIDLYGTLQCPVQFTLLTPWYDDHHQEISIDVQGPGTHRSGEMDLGEVRGDMPGSIRFSASTAMWDFNIQIVDKNTNATLWSETVDITDYGYTDLAGGDLSEIEYSSRPDDQYYIYRNFRDPSNPVEYRSINYVDITKDIYYKIPIGTNVKLIINVLGTRANYPVVVNAQLFDYYRSV